jgi:hypothetical protein
MAAEALTKLRLDMAGQNFEITKSLGLEREKKAYDSRLKALTDPTTYADERGKKWDAMLLDISAYFDKTIGYLTAVGFGWDDAKDKAKELTKGYTAIERQKLELIYPTGANVIGAQRQVDLAYGEAGTFNPAELTAAAQHAAPIQPARKRSSRKKKSS